MEEELPYSLGDVPEPEPVDKTPVLVCTMPSGIQLWKIRNEVGGWQYLTDSCGIHAVIWDSALNSKEELLAIAKDCYGIDHLEIKINDRKPIPISANGTGVCRSSSQS